MSTAPAPKTKKIHLTDEDVVNLVDCAGTGIAYWAACATVDEDAKTYYVVSGEVVEMEDFTEIEAKTLTFDEIREAFNTLAQTNKLPDWQMREIAEGDLAFDAMVADMTVQQAMFGGIIFG